MGRGERETNIDNLKRDRADIEYNLNYYSALKSVIESKDWANSGVIWIDQCRKKAFKELVEEKFMTADKKEKAVEPGEILIRQRVFNRLLSFFAEFELSYVETQIKQHVEKLKIIEKDEKEIYED